jgi:hypothetical protein
MVGALSERQARFLRWLLIIGWLALLLSLFIPASPFQGNRVFWGTVVPLSLLLTVASAMSSGGASARLPLSPSWPSPSVGSAPGPSGATGLSW